MEGNQDIVAEDMKSAVDAADAATRLFVAVALRSVEELHGAVSLAQFRLLLTLDELGCSPSSQVAAALGVGASSVTRLADRLSASGHLRRGTDPRSRCVVTLELTDAGRALVERVMRRRREEIQRILGRLRPDESAAITRILHRLVEAADDDYTMTRGPMPL